MKYITASTKRNARIFLISLLALIFVTGCAASPEQIAVQTATAQTAIAALWTPTPTLTITPTATATATDTPSPTATKTPTLPPTITATSGPRTRFTFKKVTFSLIAPEGWEETYGNAGPMLAGPKDGLAPLSLTFNIDQNTMLGEPMEADEVGIAMYSAMVQDVIEEQAKDLVQLSEVFSQTASGKPYFKSVIEHKTNGNELHQTIYIFGSGLNYLTMIYTRPISGGEEYDQMIEGAVLSLLFEK